MITLTVETDTHERYNLIYGNGGFGGKAIYAFVMVAWNYGWTGEDTPREPQTEWFDAFQGLLHYPFDTTLQILEQCCYNFEWYGVRDAINIEQLKMMESRFVNAVTLLQIVVDMLKVFTECELPETDWYQKENTVPDFLALQQTIELALARKSTKVWLNIL